MGCCITKSVVPIVTGKWNQEPVDVSSLPRQLLRVEGFILLLTPIYTERMWKLSWNPKPPPMFMLAILEDNIINRSYNQVTYNTFRWSGLGKIYVNCAILKIDID